MWCATVILFYGSDFDSSLLSTHLEIFSENFQPSSPPEKQTIVSDILTFFSPGQVQLMHEVGNIIKLLVMPATKLMLRVSSHLELFNVLKHTDELDMIGITNNFI